MPARGFATDAGTSRYAKRYSGRAGEGHFRRRYNLAISSFGIGTYLGQADEGTDRAYADAVVQAVEGGVNLIDSAINYRYQRSERAIGQAIGRLAAAGFAREEMVLCTKAGFLTPDGAPPADFGAHVRREYIDSGILRAEEIAPSGHSIAPKFLEDQLERSRRNLEVEAIDVYYLHNPESQLTSIAGDEFYSRLRAAFEFLERAATEKKIQFYGMATWTGFRQPPEARDYLSLAKIVKLAREVAGERHRFRFVQLPFNLAMPDALTQWNQSVDGREAPMAEAAGEEGIALVASAALLQGRLAKGLPEFVRQTLGTDSDSEAAIEFARSAPGFTAALVGMSRPEHVERNLQLVARSPVPEEQFARLFDQRS